MDKYIYIDLLIFVISRNACTYLLSRSKENLWSKEYPRQPKPPGKLSFALVAIQFHKWWLDPGVKIAPVIAICAFQALTLRYEFLNVGLALTRL